MEIPEPFRGVWRRRSLTVAGGPAGEHERVLWLQTPLAFADVRVTTDPGSGAVRRHRAFAGTTSHRPGRLRWEHELDSDPSGVDDHAEVAWAAGTLVERGVWPHAGRMVPYEERWDRIRRCGSYTAARTTDGRGRLVRVEDRAIAVADWRDRGLGFAIRVMRRAGGRWRDVLLLGPGAARLPSPTTVAVDAAAGSMRRCGAPLRGAETPDGWQVTAAAGPPPGTARSRGPAIPAVPAPAAGSAHDRRPGEG